MSGKSSVMSTNNCARTYFWWVCACAPYIWFVHPSNWHPPFTYHPLNGPSMCAVDNLQCLRFGNSQSLNKFTGNPKTSILPTSSQESVKHKPMFTFTFTLCTIYGVNGTAWYLERCWPATNSDTILAALLRHEEDRISKLAVKNRSQQIRSKQMVD